MDYKNGRVAHEIIELQKADGTWGNIFHSLSQPNKRYPLTTEQALRRLKGLGFTIKDEPIRKAVDCMVSCLLGEKKIDDYYEKTRDWDLFTKTMLSTWIKIFEPDNEAALNFAGHWGNVIEKAFENGVYDQNAYVSACQDEFSMKLRDASQTDFSNFYHVNLLQGVLSEKTEGQLLDYILARSGGIYYVYYKPINQLPGMFASKATSHYLAAIEILSGYRLAKDKLGVVVKWLEDNRDENGQWDLGVKANDNIYFPLSDSWRRPEYRRADCTNRITAILNILK